MGLGGCPPFMASVKNRLYDPTKVQIGQDQYRIDVMNDCQEKALQEACHERE